VRRAASTDATILARLELAEARASALASHLAEVVAERRGIGGYMLPETQALLRSADALIAETEGRR
jgi:hypothetical protein